MATHEMHSRASSPPPDVDIGYRLTITACVMIVPSVITTAMRLRRRHTSKALGGDDWVILTATLFSITMSALSLAGVAHGKGRHEIYLARDQTNAISELSFVNQIILFVLLCLVKISICLLILRIKQARWLKLSLGTVMALMIVSTIIPIAALLAECSPVRAFWDRSLVKEEKATCHSPDFRIYAIYVQAGYSMLTDLICSLLPILILRDLQISQRKKVGLLALMALGLTATAFAGLRAASLGGTNISDTTYTYTMTGVWMTIEANLGILGTNLPIIRHVFFEAWRKATGQASTVQGTTRGSAPTWQHHQFGSSKTARRPSAADSDQSQVPLNAILQTKQFDISETKGPTSVLTEVRDTRIDERTLQRRSDGAFGNGSWPMR